MPFGMLPAAVAGLPASSEVCLDLAPASPTGVFDPTKPVEFILHASSLLGRPVTADVSWCVVDYFGREAASGMAGLRLPPFGGDQQKLVLPLSQTGAYRVTVSVRCPGVPVQTVAGRAVLLRPQEDHRLRPRSMFGVNAGAHPACEERALLSASGARWVRQSYAWSEIERELGSYTFPPELDAEVAGLQSLGLSVLAVLGCRNPAYDGGGVPTSTEAVAAYARFCQAMVRRWGGPGPVRAWEIGGDAGIGSPAGRPAGYVQVLRAAYNSIKRAHRAATVVGGATDGIDTTFLEGVLRAGGADCMDAVAVRFAPCLAERGRLAEGLRRVRAVLARHRAGRKAIWVTRFGAPPGSEGGGEGADAATLAQAYVGILASREAQVAFWGSLQEGAASPEGPAECGGLIGADLAPRPALLAYRTLAGQLEDLRYRSTLGGGLLQAHRFESGGQAVIAAWSVRGESACALVTGEPRLTVVDLMGNARELATTEGAVIVPLSEAPCFVRLPRTARATLYPVLFGPAGTTEIAAGQAAVVPLALRIPFAEGAAGAVRVAAPAGWTVDVCCPSTRPAPGVEEKVELRIRHPSDARPGDYDIRVGVDFAHPGVPSACLLVPVRVGGSQSASP